MKNTTTTTAAKIAPILQSYINVCGITQYVESMADNFDVIENIKCDLRICNLISRKKPSDCADRDFLVSDARCRDIELPERTQVLIFYDKITAPVNMSIFDRIGVDLWHTRQAAAGHIVAVLAYFPPVDDCVCVLQSAPDKHGRTKKLFIFGGATNAENTRS
ncbi:MAG: hypothetical protein NC489_46860 [Ruminococcus flavefaciens]|nr:hypothetical protein [Ruminococcus flavefaciens]